MTSANPASNELPELCAENQRRESSRSRIPRDLSKRSLVRKSSDRHISKNHDSTTRPHKSRDGIPRVGSFHTPSRKDSSKTHGSRESASRAHPEKSASFRVCRKEASREMLPDDSADPLSLHRSSAHQKCRSPRSESGGEEMLPVDSVDPLEAHRSVATKKSSSPRSEGGQKALKKRVSSKSQEISAAHSPEGSPRSVTNGHRERHFTRLSPSDVENRDAKAATEKRRSRIEPRGEGVHRQSSKKDMMHRPSSKNDLNKDSTPRAKRSTRSSKTEGHHERRTPPNEEGHTHGKHRRISSRTLPERANSDSGDSLLSKRRTHDDKEKPRRPDVSLGAHLDDKRRTPRRTRSSGDTQSVRSSGTHSRRTSERTRRTGGTAAVREQDRRNQLVRCVNNQNQDAERQRTLNGAGAKHLMIDGVAPGYNLARFVEENEAGTIGMVAKTWRMLREISNYEEVGGILVFTQ